MSRWAEILDLYKTSRSEALDRMFEVVDEAVERGDTALLDAWYEEPLPDEAVLTLALLTATHPWEATRTPG